MNDDVINTGKLTITGSDFNKIKKELISCINAFWRHNTMDLCMITFIQDPTVPNSVVPILMYESAKMIAYNYVFRTPTDEDEETGKNHFDPITVSPPLIIHPNKWGIRDIIFSNIIRLHTEPVPINPIGLKSKLQDDSIVALEIDFDDRSFKFKTPLGFVVDEDPIFWSIGFHLSIPFILYAKNEFNWKQHSLEMVCNMNNVISSSHIYDGDECETLFNVLKTQGSTETPKGIKIFIDFIKQKPLKTIIFNNNNEKDKMMSVCAESHYKEVVVYAFYAYTTGW